MHTCTTHRRTTLACSTHVYTRICAMHHARMHHGRVGGGIIKRSDVGGTNTYRAPCITDTHCAHPIAEAHCAPRIADAYRAPRIANTHVASYSTTDICTYMRTCAHLRYMRA